MTDIQIVENWVPDGICPKCNYHYPCVCKLQKRTKRKKILVDNYTPPTKDLII